MQNSQENTGARVSFLVNCTKKETLAQVFSWEFSEIFKNFTEKGATASASTKVPKWTSRISWSCHILVYSLTIFNFWRFTIFFLINEKKPQNFFEIMSSDTIFMFLQIVYIRQERDALFKSSLVRRKLQSTWYLYK